MLPVYWYVNSPIGLDHNYGLSKRAPVATISAAVNRSKENDVVVIEPGTYSGIGNRDISVTRGL